MATDMLKKTGFASPQVAEQMAQVFGQKAKTVSVEMKHRRQVGDFVRKIEKAHKQAAKSTLAFR
ncbi:MAG: hypothetical protein RRC34_14385 [Lentisphaeria bacterium]|nr:hypothetical protein [Lentisphaeria bacterium]